MDVALLVAQVSTTAIPGTATTSSLPPVIRVIQEGGGTDWVPLATAIITAISTALATLGAVWLGHWLNERSRRKTELRRVRESYLAAAKGAVDAAFALRTARNEELPGQGAEAETVTSERLSSFWERFYKLKSQAWALQLLVDDPAVLEEVEAFAEELRQAAWAPAEQREVSQEPDNLQSRLDQLKNTVRGASSQQTEAFRRT